MIWGPSKTSFDCFLYSGLPVLEVCSFLLPRRWCSLHIDSFLTVKCLPLASRSVLTRGSVSSNNAIGYVISSLKLVHSVIFGSAEVWYFIDNFNPVHHFQIGYFSYDRDFETTCIESFLHCSPGNCLSTVYPQYSGTIRFVSLLENLFDTYSTSVSGF